MLRRHLKRAGASAVACAGFDADTAGAYLEQSLGGLARARYEDHLAACSSCRRHVVELFRLMPSPAASLVAPVTEAGERWSFTRWFDRSHWRWDLRVVAGVSGAIVVGLTTYFIWHRPAERSPLAAASKTTSAAPQAKDVSEPQASAAPQLSASPQPGLEQMEARQRAESLERNQNRARQSDDQSGRAAGAVDHLAARRESAAGQSALNKTIAGTVSDPSGAAVPGAQVTLLDSNSQQPRAATTTDAVGRFNFTNLPEGNYIAQVQVPGFKTQQAPVRTIDSRPSPLALRTVTSGQVTVKLEPGSPSETVAVTAVDGPAAVSPRDLRTGSLPSLASSRLAPAPPPAAGDKAAEPRDERAAQPATAERAQAEKEELKSEELSKPREARRLVARGTASGSQIKPPAAGSAGEPLRPKHPSLLSLKVGDKTFRFERSVWVDNAYDPKYKFPVLQLTHGSPEFEQALSDTPALKQFFDLGQVTVVWRGKVYEVRKKE